MKSGERQIFLKNLLIMVNINDKIKYLYLILTGIFLLTFGPFNTVFVSLIHEWNIFTISVCSLIIGILLIHDRKGLSDNNSIFMILCLTYAGSIIVNSLFHGIALHTIPEIKINVLGGGAYEWRHNNIFLTMFYLFFPVLFLLQLILLRKIGLKVIVRIISFVITVSLLVLFYQKYHDISFLNKPYFLWMNRVGGLSHDANAFAMTAFLLIPLFVSGIVIEGMKVVKVYYGSLIMLLIVGLTFTGNRTAFGGLLLFIISVPAVSALVNKQMSRSIRLALFVSPVILLLMAVVLLPSLMNNFQSSLPSLERTISTLEDFRNGGLREVLFNSDQRGTNYIVAWDMLKSSPLAGWGPAGFHRESSTFLILRLGYKLVVDSALNHYLMIGADLGLPVLFLSLVMIISPLVIALSTIKRLSDNKMRYVVAFTLAANIIFLILIITIPPTFFPGLVWVWTAQLAYLILIGGNYGIKKTITANRLRITFFIVLGILISVFFGAYQTTFGSKGYVARQDLDWWPYKYERNCYGTETWEDNILRWCKNNASMQFVIRSNSPSSNTFRAKLMVNHPDLKSRPVTVKYGGKEGTVNELLFQDYSTKEIEIPVTEEYIYELMSLQNTPYSRFVLNLDVSRTWVPKEWGGEDARELGVAVITPQNYEFFY